MLLLRLVFLDKGVHLSVFLTLFAVSHFSKVAGKKLKTETVVRSCSVKKVFLETSQNSEENTCTRDSISIKLKAIEHLKLFLKNTSGACFCKSLHLYESKTSMRVFLWLFQTFGRMVAWACYFTKWT